MNKVKILFNSGRPVTTPALTEILHREKMNASVIDLEFVHAKLKFDLKNQYYNYYW